MGKCIDCGFLATRNRQSNQLEEVDIIYRDTGLSSLCGFPVCFVRANDLASEQIEIAYPSARMLSVIGKERECELFTNWQQGFTPKEHREMIYRERFEQRVREDRKSDRRWRIIEFICILIGSGLFTLLGAWIARGR